MPSLPQQFLKSLSSLDHFNEAAFIEAHGEEHKITSIRLNPFKPVTLDFEPNAVVPWNSNGFYLSERPFFTYDPLFHAGCYYPQEAGSMFLEFVLTTLLNFEETLNILDACAAPGGKSTLINSLLNKHSLLVANEIVKSRADILTQNLSKWGTSNTVVTNNEPQRFSELYSFFDAIVVDAPCSGSGLFRKQPEAISEWSEQQVNACSIRQKKILSEVLPALNENGILVYSTCSYSVAENEDIVKWLVAEQQMEYLPLPVDPNWGIVDTGQGYRFYPHLTRSEGFFCAALRKTHHSGKLPSANIKKLTPAKIPGELSALMRPFIGETEANVIKKNEQWHLLNTEATGFLSAFEKKFYFKKAGTVIGEVKGRDLVPNQELAWFCQLNTSVPQLELDKETALKFLKKEPFTSNNTAKGLVLIRYKQQGLGWAKILPNRINNYYPNELRILKQHI